MYHIDKVIKTKLPGDDRKWSEIIDELVANYKARLLSPGEYHTTRVKWINSLTSVEERNELSIDISSQLFVARSELDEVLRLVDGDELIELANGIASGDVLAYQSKRNKTYLFSRQNSRMVEAWKIIRETAPNETVNAFIRHMCAAHDLFGGTVPLYLLYNLWVTQPDEIARAFLNRYEMGQ